ncbi:uncharacterized protein LOC135694726 [Rhopilema esculentum]|uniref:uncharacterized protein LOC135694726 n=1 Tax=Rhopilema esculentum TaxID=499914 RepID=UPI0031D518FD|eukprot:gene4485-20728_t
MGFNSSLLGFFIFLYAVIFALGIVLNISILTVVLSSRLNRSKISNLYLIQFLIIDVISCIINSSYHLTTLLVHLPPPDSRTRAAYANACRVTIFLVYALSVAKILSLTLLSFERFIAVHYPLHYSKYANRKLLLFLTVYIVLQAVCTLLPSTLKPGWIVYFGEVGGACGINWGATVAYYAIPVILLDFVIPAVVLVVTNVSVFVIARRQRIRDSELRGRSQPDTPRKTELAKTLIKTVCLMETGNGQQFQSKTGSERPRSVLSNERVFTIIDDVTPNHNKLFDIQEVSNDFAHAADNYGSETANNSNFSSRSSILCNHVNANASEHCQQESCMSQSRNNNQKGFCRHREKQEVPQNDNKMVENPISLQDLAALPDKLQGYQVGKIDKEEQFNELNQSPNLYQMSSNEIRLETNSEPDEEYSDTLQNGNVDDVIGNSKLEALAEGKSINDLHDRGLGVDSELCAVCGNQEIDEESENVKGCQPRSFRNASCLGAFSHDQAPNGVVASTLKNTGTSPSGEIGSADIIGVDSARYTCRCSTLGFSDGFGFADNDEFSHLTRQKRLRLLSLPNLAASALETEEAKWNIVHSTLLVVLCHFITYLPFIVSRLVETFTVQRILSSEASAATAAVNNIDVVIIPLIVLWTRANFRKELKTKLNTCISFLKPNRG